MENRNTFYKMTKTVTHIDCPKEWESENDWDSHRNLLWLATEKMEDKDAVYEFGCGFGSSPLLSKLNRLFNSYETNKEWADKFPHTVCVDSYFNIPFPTFLKNSKIIVGLLFIDCAPAEIRKELIDKWRNNAKVIVAHDSESGAEYVYGMSEVLNSFKYKLDYQPIGKPATTIVSETINVCEWI